jgi:hypothetical protein
MMRMLFHGKSSESGISSFQTFSLALSDRTGTGNIAGVAESDCLVFPAKGSFENFFRFQKTIIIRDWKPRFRSPKLNIKNTDERK